MKNKSLSARFICTALLFGAILFSSPTFAQSLWQFQSKAALPKDKKPMGNIKNARYYTLDFNALKTLLDHAPEEQPQPVSKYGLIVSLPTPGGLTQKFIITSYEVMEKPLSRKYPEIRAFYGRGVDDPSAEISLDYTYLGFHAQVLSAKGNFKIEPIFLNDRQWYAVFAVSDQNASALKFKCGTTQETSSVNKTAGNPQPDQVQFAFGNTRKTYRLALAVDVEFSANYGSTKPNSLSAMTTRMNRINAIFSRDAAIRFVMVANTDELIYLAEPDPYTDTSTGMLFSQNQTNCDAVIGNGNYDIGHVFGVAGGGGLARLSSVCKAAEKAMGCSSTIPAIELLDNVTTHEFGHQCGAGHSWNGTQGSCVPDQYAINSAVEPGSGCTMMSYGGNAGSDNIIQLDDFLMYFHNNSIKEIITYTTTQEGNTCGVTAATGNTIPTVSVSSPSGKTIPHSTPYQLIGAGSDADGEQVTYTWEQVDAGGPAGPPTDSSRTTGPLTRSFEPATFRNFRTVPLMYDLFNNTKTKGNMLGTASRAMNFRLTARDNSTGVRDASFAFNITENAGPFKFKFPVSSYNVQGRNSTVTWDVANTNLAPVSCSLVNILLSEDYGSTFPTTLAANTPNDGSEAVLFPNNGNNLRIKIEAVNNIFFAISKGFNVAEYCYDNSGCYSGAAINSIKISSSTPPNQFGPLCSAGGYRKFDYITTSGLEVGEVYPFEITLASSAQNVGVGVWVDYNYDLDFDDAGEFIFGTTSLVSGSGPITFNYLIPPYSGGYTAIRVRVMKDRIPHTGDACYDVEYGETEDSHINIIPGPCYDKSTCFIQGLGNMYISRVRLGSIDQSSSCTSVGYKSYMKSVQPANLSFGQTYPITINTSTQNNLGIGVWIDYNNDQDFDDAGEFVFQGLPSLTGSFTRNITIPGDPAYKGYRRMRVRSGLNTTFDATMSCFDINLGETEDYRIFIDGYCNAQSVCQDVDFGTHYISSVSFAGVTTNSTCSPNGYSVFTDSASARTVYKGTTIQGTVTVAGGNPCGKALWIDYNDDGDFDDLGEYVMNSQGINSFTWFFFINTNNAPLGYRRMRIRSASNMLPAANQSCTNFAFGETEDYLVNFTLGLTLGSIDDSYCAGGFYSFNFSTQGNFDAQNSFGIHLSDSVGDFSNPYLLGSTTTSPLTATLPANLPPGNGYRFKLFSNSPAGFESVSAPVQINQKPIGTSLSPTSGPPGTVVTITGTNLGVVQNVYMGQFPAQNLVVTSDGNSLTFTVPQGASSGPIYMSGLCQNQGPSFTVTPPCDLMLSPNIVQVPPSSEGCADGSILFSYTGTSIGQVYVHLIQIVEEESYIYLLSHQPNANQQIIFNNIAAGQYLAILDDLGSECGDTLIFNVTALPCALALSNLSATETGPLNNGTINFQATGFTCGHNIMEAKKFIAGQGFVTVSNNPAYISGTGYRFVNLSSGDYRIVLRNDTNLCKDSALITVPAIVVPCNLARSNNGLALPSQPGCFNGQIFFDLEAATPGVASATLLRRIPNSANREFVATIFLPADHNITFNGLGYGIYDLYLNEGNCVDSVIAMYVNQLGNPLPCSIDVLNATGNPSNGSNGVITFTQGGTGCAQLIDQLKRLVNGSYQPVPGATVLYNPNTGLLGYYNLAPGQYRVIQRTNSICGDSADVTVGSISSIVATPVISPPTGTYSQSQIVNISCSTEGATIYYTTSGNLPVIGTGFTKVYTAPILLLESTTVRAMAVKSGMTNSPVAVSFITITNPGICAAAMVSPGTGSYEGSATITMTTATADAQIWYTINGNLPLFDVPNSFTRQYTGPFVAYSNMAIKAVVKKTGFANSPYTSANITITSPTVVATPTFNPLPGFYAGAQAITLTTTTPGTQIYYALNGYVPRLDVPNSFTRLYTGPFTVSQSTTIRAFAVRTGWLQSGTAVGIYTFGGARGAVAGFEGDEPETESLLVFPNPATDGLFHILVTDAQAEIVEYTLLGVDGKTIEAGRIKPGITQVADLSRNPAGIYILKMNIGDRMEIRRLSKL